MDDAEFYGIIRAVYYIADGGFRYTAFYVELILCHTMLLKQFGQPFADRFVQFHFHHRPCCFTKIIIGTLAVLIVPAPVLLRFFVLNYTSYRGCGNDNYILRTQQC